MNYLAHAWLSFRQPSVLVGNMISDFIKGRKQFDYPLPVQEGIRLHRAIDAYTDEHPVTREAKQYFKPAVGLYAGAFVDIVYDHFLALDTAELSETGWKLFSSEVYAMLSDSKQLLPHRFATMFPYMHQQDWLFNYRYRQGIENSFRGLVRRAQYLSDAARPFDAFQEHYDALKTLYGDFFPGVKNMALTHLTERAIL
ncbi:acyl carrier protein phosphodiesterase [Sediminibacterium soli]|uniref:acyl carrier protein phosphodiesterase n=1 Tax=Sediminibacterium soli TaxID=2698829 RepID=UPI00137A82A2|nr:ACP phosphodiesterase [Sediminibacterium soli]NCI47685.1 DUF479 domain-containing protein [Sediminibacterium soli]